MDLDKIVNSVIADVKTPQNRQNLKNSAFDHEKNLPVLRTEKQNQETRNAFPGSEDFTKFPLIDLVKRHDIKENDLLRLEIYSRFETDIENRLQELLVDCKDINKDKGLYKCSLETWQYFINDIGLFYFRKNKLLRDYKRIETSGGGFLNDDLLFIALELYESLCNKYRKQFFIYDCCRFCGIDKDNMYRLSDIHSLYMKKAHTIQESSYRTALASGRSNVTAMAILLNHDYDYTKTTQVIHTNGNQIKSADSLPTLTTENDIEVL